MRRDAAREEGVELVLDELRQAGAKVPLGLSKKGCGVLLREALLRRGINVARYLVQ